MTTDHRLQPGDTYTCAKCQKEIVCSTTPEERKEEHDGFWPGASLQTAVVICEECFQLIGLGQVEAAKNQ